MALRSKPGFFLEPSPNCVEAYRDAATIWWARLTLGSDNASGQLALLKFEIVILVTVKRGPNLGRIATAGTITLE